MIVNYEVLKTLEGFSTSELDCLIKKAKNSEFAGKVNEFRPDMQIYFDFPPEKEGKDWNEVLIKRKGCSK